MGRHRETPGRGRKTYLTVAAEWNTMLMFSTMNALSPSLIPKLGNETSPEIALTFSKASGFFSLILLKT